MYSWPTFRLSLTAPFDGTVSEVSVATGDQVEEGSLLVAIEKQAEGG